MMSFIYLLLSKKRHKNRFWAHLQLVLKLWQKKKASITRPPRIFTDLTCNKEPAYGWGNGITWSLMQAQAQKGRQKMKWFLCLMAQLIWQESDLPVTPWTVNMPCSLEGLKVTELKNSHPSTTANLFCLLLAGQDKEQRPGPPAARLTLWEQKASPALSGGRARVWCLGCAKSLRPPGGESRLQRSSTRPKPAVHTPHRPAQRPTRGNTRTSPRSPALPLPPGAGASLLISAQKFVGGWGWWVDVASLEPSQFA